MLIKTDQEILLRMAKEAIEESLLPDNRRQGSTTPFPEPLRILCGAFVSLYVKRDLRGCIGTFNEDLPLHENVRNMAISAATTDTRFKPILRDELKRLIIEISVLSPRVRVHDISEIILGKHGIFMTRGSRRGTLLPQVAVTQNWSVEEFLGNCARDKAGIGWDGWKNAELFTYEAFIFRSSPSG